VYLAQKMQQLGLNLTGRVAAYFAQKMRQLGLNPTSHVAMYFARKMLQLAIGGFPKKSLFLGVFLY